MSHTNCQTEDVIVMKPKIAHCLAASFLDCGFSILYWVYPYVPQVCRELSQKSTYGKPLYSNQPLPGRSLY